MKLFRLLKPTLLDAYIVREMMAPTLLGLLLFTFVVLLRDIPRLLETLISRSADPATILRVFLELLPSILAVTIPMAFLLGVLIAFGRLASESEIVALRASGVSPLRMLRPVLLLSSAACLATFYVLAVLVPRANQSYREMLFSLIVSRARATIAPRVFTDDLLPSRSLMLYVSDIPAHTGEWTNVFLHDVRDPRRPQVILAKSGSLLIDKERRAVGLVLRDGWIHAFNPADPMDYRRSRFKDSGFFPLSFDELFPKIPLSKGDREMSLGELEHKIAEMRTARQDRVEIGRYLVEWHKKFSIPVACVVFGLLGLGLSLGSKKEARSAAFGLSIAVIFIYYVIIRLGEQAGDTGLMAPWLAMWGADLVLGVIALALLVLNHREAAFDPLDWRHYAILLPRLRLRPKPVPHAPRRPSHRPRPAVVVRVPRFSLPVPGLLDLYIARTYFGFFVLVMVSFCSLYALIELLDLFDDVGQNKVKGITLVRYFAYHMPAIAQQMIPMSVLVAVLVTFGVLSRRNEITAMKAGGISLYRVVLPSLALSVAGSVCLFALGEYILPAANKVATRHFNVIKGRPPESSNALDHRWLLGSDGRFYNYEYIQEGAPGEPITLFGLSVYDVDARRWELRDRLYAGQARWKGESWAYDLERCWRRTFDEQGALFHQWPALRTAEIEPPSYFRRERPASETLRFAELARHIDSLEELGLDVIRLRVQLQGKLAFPMVAVVMTMIGVPFAFVVAKRGALHGIGISILVAIVYWACLQSFQALGNNAWLPPLLAAWAPNLLFGVAGLYLMFTLDT